MCRHFIIGSQSIQYLNSSCTVSGKWIIRHYDTVHCKIRIVGIADRFSLNLHSCRKRSYKEGRFLSRWRASAPSTNSPRSPSKVPQKQVPWTRHPQPSKKHMCFRSSLHTNAGTACFHPRYWAEGSVECGSPVLSLRVYRKIQDGLGFLRVV